jgi:pimeloyl-ACP methyl ester carboxylesterase
LWARKGACEPGKLANGFCSPIGPKAPLGCCQRSSPRDEVDFDFVARMGATVGWTKIPSVAASLMLVLALVVPRVATGRDAILTVDGQRFHLETLGESGPTIVFEAGLGNDSSTWRLVAAPVATFARVVLYDRAGLGQSLPMINKSSAVTADQVASNLRKLLTTADIRPPYMLVGHSLGGLFVQMFVRKYPREVLGVVLLDSSSAEAPSELKTRAQLTPGTAAYLEEAGVAESNKQVASGGAFPDIPLTVIAATDHGPFFKNWEPTLMQLQRQLAALSPRSVFIVAQGSGHDVQIDRPGTVIEAIRDMVRVVRPDPANP